MSRTRVDFAATREATLKCPEFIIQKLLPDGRRDGNEWVSLNPNRVDKTPGSFKVNLVTGVWADFATGDKGADLIGLCAFVRGVSNIEAARELADLLGVHLSSSSYSPASRGLPIKKPRSIAASPSNARKPIAAFPPRTPPDAKGKPHFFVAGDEGPRIRADEKRRHLYRQCGIPIQVKVMKKEGRPYNVYRVVDADGRTGWQYGIPDGFRKVPYFTGSDPFDAEEDIYWPEGERDVGTLANCGAPAFTFGGTGDGLPAGCEQFVRGRHLIILADNDIGGREHAEIKASLAALVAASVKVIHFPELEYKQDVSDWIQAGHTFEELKVRVEAAEVWRPEAPAATKQGDPADEHFVIRAEQRVSLPFGYAFSDRGLMWSNPNDLDKLLAATVMATTSTEPAPTSSNAMIMKRRQSAEPFCAKSVSAARCELSTSPLRIDF